MNLLRHRHFQHRMWMPLPATAGLLLILGCAYFLARVFFWGANFESFRNETIESLLTAFVWGARFDLSFLLLFNSPFLLLAFFPRKRLSRLEVWLMLILNLPPLWWNLADAAYFGFQGRRSTWGLLRLWPDLRDQAAQLAVHFWQVPLACLGLSVCLAAGFHLWSRWVKSLPLRAWHGFLLVPALVLLTVLGIRGGLETKPLGTWHAMRLPSTQLGNLALNTPFHVIKVDAKQAVQPRHDFASMQEARAAAEGNPPADPRFSARRSNVVVLIMESFALEHFGFRDVAPGYMPFLKKLSERGLYFENGFANARQSIDAVASVLGGIPALMVEPYVSSPYNGNVVKGLGSRLAERGYETYFFHGGRNGSMYIDVMARLAGFERYFGLDEYPDRADFDGVWGVFDEPFLQFTARKLAAARQPFAAGVFSLSSHNPYTVPAKYAGRFPRGTAKIHESLGYADFALQRFFETASTMPWYKNTLFVLTADHTAELKHPSFQHRAGAYRVPILFFHPGGLLPGGVSRRVTQHVDVLPSVLHFLGEDLSKLSPPLLPFGKSVFETSSAGRVVNKSGGHFWILEGSSMVSIPEDGGEVQSQELSDGFFAPTGRPVAPETRQRLERELRGYLQFYMNGLAENSWFSRD